MKCFKRKIRDWFVVVPVCLLFAAIFAQTGSYWQGFFVLAALFGIIVIYAVDNLGHAVKRSWLEKADVGNGLLSDAPNSLDCYPEGNATPGSSTNRRPSAARRGFRPTPRENNGTAACRQADRGVRGQGHGSEAHGAHSSRSERR
jgi:hypothetical protein